MSSSLPQSRRAGAQYLYMLAAFVVIVAGMRTAEPILNPLFLSIFMAIVCAPAYLSLLRRGISQWLSLLIVAGTLSAVAVFSVSVLMDSIARFTSQQAHYTAQADAKGAHIKQMLASWFPLPGAEISSENDLDGLPGNQTKSRSASDSSSSVNVASEPDADLAEPATDDGQLIKNSNVTDDPGGRPSTGATGWLYDQFDPSAMLSFAFQLAGGLSSLLSQLLLITLMVIFILLELGTFEQKLKLAFSRSKDTTEQGAQMVHNVQRYVAIKTIVSLATAILVGLWLKLFAVKFISLWMLLAFMLNFIPNVGSIAAAVPAVLIVWLDTNVSPGSGDSANMIVVKELLPAVGVAAGYVIVNVVIGNFLEPRWMGRTLGLSPLVIFCSMIFWGWVLGSTGMLLSVPLTMTVHLVLSGFDDTRWIATLMGSQPKGV